MKTPEEQQNEKLLTVMTIIKIIGYLMFGIATVILGIKLEILLALLITILFVVGNFFININGVINSDN